MHVNMKCWLSRSFKDSTCLSFLENIVSDDFLHTIINWKSCNYEARLGDASVIYGVDTITRNVNVQVNTKKRKLSISITRRGNNVEILDINSDNNTTDSYIISHNIDNTTYYSHKTTMSNRYNQVVLHFNSITIDNETGNVIKYYNTDEYDRDNSIINNGNNQFQYTKSNKSKLIRLG